METDEAHKGSVLFRAEEPAEAYLLADMLNIMSHCVMLQYGFGLVEPEGTDINAAAKWNFFARGKAVLHARRVEGEIGITELYRSYSEFAVPDTATYLFIGETERVKPRFGIRAPEHEIAAFMLYEYGFLIREAEPFDVSAHESLLHIDCKHSAPAQNIESMVVIKFFQSFFLKYSPLFCKLAEELRGFSDYFIGKIEFGGVKPRVLLAAPDIKDGALCQLGVVTEILAAAEGLVQNRNR